MKFPQPRTFFCATSPVILASWVFGMGIFEHPTGHQRPKISLCWSIAHLLIFLSCITIAVLNNLTPWENSPISNVSYQIFLCASTISIILFLYLGRKGSKNVVATLRKLDTVNEMLKNYEIPEEYGLTFQHQVIQLTVAFLYISIMLAYNIYWTAHVTHFRIAHFGYLAALHYIPICSFIVNCTFANLIRYIGKRFQYLNANFVQSSFQKDDINSFLQDLESDASLRRTRLEIHANQHFVRLADKQWMFHLIWNSRKIHQELSSAARTFNKAFGVQILLSMTASLVLITAILYGAYNIILTSTSKPSSLTIKDLGILMCWLAFYAWKFLYVVFVCSKTVDEAQRMGELIHLVDKPTIDRRVREEVQAFSLLLMRNPLQFTASGFFALDYQMIRSMVGAVTTYLVIMIQLRDSGNTKSASVNDEVHAINSTR